MTKVGRYKIEVAEARKEAQAEIKEIRDRLAVERKREAEELDAQRAAPRGSSSWHRSAAGTR